MGLHRLHLEHCTAAVKGNSKWKHSSDGQRIIQCKVRWDPWRHVFMLWVVRVRHATIVSAAIALMTSANSSSTCLCMFWINACPVALLLGRRSHRDAAPSVGTISLKYRYFLASRASLSLSRHAVHNMTHCHLRTGSSCRVIHCHLEPGRARSVIHCHFRTGSFCRMIHCHLGPGKARSVLSWCVH